MATGGYGYSGNTNGNYYYNLTQGVGSADQAANNAITAQGQMTGAQQKALQVANMAAMHGQTAGGGYGGPGASYGSGGGAGGYGYSSAGGAQAGGYTGDGTVAGSYQAALDAANQANQQRFNQATGDLSNLYSRTMGSYAQGNAQQDQDLRTQFQGTGSQISQDMIDRGLTGSTVSANLQADNQNQGNQAVARNDFNYQDAQRQADQNLTGGQVSLLASKNDIAPDMNAMIALQQGLGQAGGYGAGMGASFGGAGGVQAGYGSLMSMGAGLGALGSDYGQPTYGGSSYQYPTSSYGNMSQQQIMALQQQNGYNAGYSNQGVGGYSGSAGPANYQVLGSMPNYGGYV